MFSLNIIPREKSSAVSQSEFEFSSESAMRKTVGLSHAEGKEMK